MNSDWYRNTAWNEEIEKYFFKKLSRVRDKGMQAQYLNLKAGALAYTKEPELMTVAETLLNKQLQEYPDRMYVSGAYCDLGDIYGFRGDYIKALDFYKQAIDFEAQCPQFISTAYRDYSELAVKTGRTDLYADVEKVLSEKRYDASAFPVAEYRKYAILSIISKHGGDTDKAKYYADLAEVNVAKPESGYSKHKTPGLVTERDKWLDELMYG